MKLANATNLNRKFGKPRDLQSAGPLENTVGNPAAEAIRTQGTVLEIGPVLVFVVDRPDGEAMVVNVQPYARHQHKVAAVAVAEGKVELAVADHEFPIRLPTAETPAESGTELVVILVHIVDLVEAEKTHFPFHSQMPPKVEIHKAADAI